MWFLIIATITDVPLLVGIIFEKYIIKNDSGSVYSVLQWQNTLSKPRATM